MQQMINDLLLYSRVQTQAHDFVTTDSKRALDQALANLGALIKGSNAVITSDHLPKITADSDQMIVIFQNLIGNAIKYQKPGVVPEIHVSAQKDENNWTFSVTDNGIGIDERYVDRLFKIFSRLHTRTEYPGTGIGLAVCKRIVERHGGAIGVTSVPDAGSTFSFTIPLQQKENKS
jgi:chemotaxis family two-component system sensor kinase Cph1